MAHRQTQGRRFGEPDLGCEEFPSYEQALYGHTVDRGADGFGRGVEPIVARDRRFDEYIMLDPRAARNTSAPARAPVKRTQFMEESVFVVGGAGYVEYGNLDNGLLRLGDGSRTVGQRSGTRRVL